MPIAVTVNAAEGFKESICFAAWPAKGSRIIAKCTKAVVYAIMLAGTSAAVANPTAQYPRMAPLDAYLMDRTQEIALAKSAAPSSISNDATILVLTRTGYETAVTGTNGFVCMVSRSFSGASDWPERWNPKIRAAECLNPAAARTVMPFAKLRTAMILTGKTTTEIIDRIRLGLSTKEIPPLEPGAMSYMMSRSSYLTDVVMNDKAEHTMPHLMFFVPVKNGADWGANAPGSPVIGGNYWFFMPKKGVDTVDLPTLSVFLVGVSSWSDGTPAPMHGM